MTFSVFLGDEFSVIYCHGLLYYSIFKVYQRLSVFLILLSSLQLLTKRTTSCCARALTTENVNHFYFRKTIFFVLEPIFSWVSKEKGFNTTHKLLYFISTINTQDARIRCQSPGEFRIPPQKLRSFSQTIGSGRNKVKKENQREEWQLKRILKTTLQ